ncbi:MAG: hypothetical protein U0165_05645 [Polyangiaceae bacterium]
MIDIAELPPMLHGDGLRLGQILLNFATNALKFTEKGYVLISGKIVDSGPYDPTSALRGVRYGDWSFYRADGSALLSVRAS